MKSTGIVRKVDELGRVVIPIELRRVLGIEVKDPLEILVEDNKIILRKFESDIEKDEVVKGLEALAANAKSSFEKDILERARKLVK